MKALDIATASISFAPNRTDHTHVLLATTLTPGGDQITGMFMVRVLFDDKPLIAPNDRRMAWVTSPDRYAGAPSLYWRNDDGTWENEDASLILLHPRV